MFRLFSKFSPPGMTLVSCSRVSSVYQAAVSNLRQSDWRSSIPVRHAYCIVRVCFIYQFTSTAKTLNTKHESSVVTRLAPSGGLTVMTQSFHGLIITITTGIINIMTIRVERRRIAHHTICGTAQGMTAQVIIRTREE